MEEHHKLKERTAPSGRKTTGQKENKKSHLNRSASQGSIESSQSQPEQPEAVLARKTLPGHIKAAVKHINWYYLRMYSFFFAVGLLLVALNVTFNSSTTPRDRFDDYVALRNRAYSPSSTNSSLMGTIFNYLYYRNTVIVIAIIDALVLVFAISMKLNKAENRTVQEAKRNIEEELESTPRNLLSDPQNPARIRIIEMNDQVNKIVGYKRFKIRMIRLESAKEIFTLDLLLLLGCFLSRRVLFGWLDSELSEQLQALTEFLITAFIGFKNTVYLNHRIGDRTELTLHKRVAILFYVLVCGLKLVAMLELFAYVDSLLVGLAAVVAAFLLYRVMDMVNDLKQVNTVRVVAFLAAFSK